MQFSVNNMEIELVQGDITELDIDAITNAANSSLILGAGVAGAIYRKGGQQIQDECNAIGYCEVGNAVITTGGNLKAKHVIHAVGPRMGEGQEKEKLAKAIHAVLSISEKHHLNSVAIPAISTGIFGFPMKECASIMAQKLIDFSYEMRAHLHRVLVCLYDSVAYQIFSTAFMEALSKVDDENKDTTLLLDE